MVRTSGCSIETAAIVLKYCVDLIWVIDVFVSLFMQRTSFFDTWGGS